MEYKEYKECKEFRTNVLDCGIVLNSLNFLNSLNSF